MFVHIRFKNIDYNEIKVSKNVGAQKNYGLLYIIDSKHIYLYIIIIYLIHIAKLFILWNEKASIFHHVIPPSG